MKIKIDEIQKIIMLVLSNLREAKGNEIELENDFYWDILSDELYNPYEDPKDISLGQLSWDLEEIKRLLKSPEEVMPYDLKRIAEILKAIGDSDPYNVNNNSL